MSQRVVAIYRHDLLPYSETFVLEQAENLRRYEAFYAGLRRVAGTELPAGRVATAGGPAGRAWFLATGRMAALERARPAIIHAHFEGGGMGALAVARRLRVPLVVTCHGWDATVDDGARNGNPILRAMYGRLRRRMFREAAGFLAVSEHIRACMVRRGYPEEKITVHAIGVDCSRFSRTGAGTRENLVVFCGRLVEKKGCRYLLEAMGRAGVAARLAIVGDGVLRGELEALAARVFPAAEFLGVQTPEQVRGLLGRARVLCVPTVRAADGDMDGRPIVFAEANAMGVPVVSFAVGGTLEAVRHGETGLLADAHDVDGLAAAIRRLFTEPELWQACSDGGRAFVEREFDIVRQTAELENLYDRVIADYRQQGGGAA